MPTNDKPKSQDTQQNMQHNVQQDAHPAIDAVSNIKVTDVYNPDYSSGEKDTPESIRKKENRMYEIIGSRSLNAKNTSQRVMQIAQDDPQLYAELMQITADIQKYYESEHGGFYNFWKRFGQHYDFGAANSPENMAARIQSQSKSFLFQTQYGFGLGYDNLQQNAANNAKDFSDTVAVSIDYSEPAQLVDALHSIKKYYDYEVKIYNSLPDTEANRNAILASKARIYDYINAWKRCQAKIESYREDPIVFKNFLTAYQLKPLTPLTDKERTYLNTMIRQLSSGESLRNAQSAADMAVRVNERFNPFIGGK